MMLLLFVLLLAHTADSFEVRAGECDRCQLGEYFVPKNGYSCFIINGTIARCTCPDRRWKDNEPCRICNRQDICGPSDSLCSEEFERTSANENGPHYACFCTNGEYLLGQACPMAGTTTLVPPTTVVTPSPTTATTTTTTPPATTTTEEITTELTNTTTTPIIDTNTTAITNTTRTPITTTTTSRVSTTTACVPCPGRSSADRLLSSSLVILVFFLVYSMNI